MIFGSRRYAFIMTKLECSVTNCLHNSDDCCCRQAIVVDGQDAKKKEDTCCCSFDEKKEGSFMNVFQTPEKKLDVSCEAVKCIYNEDHHCIADHIGITGDYATTADQTLCASFKM